MKHRCVPRVYVGVTMNGIIHSLLVLGGLFAAGAVAAMCLVGLVVWVAGGKVAMRK